MVVKLASVTTVFATIAFFVELYVFMRGPELSRSKTGGISGED